MSPALPPLPSLPQNDSPRQQKQRHAALVEQHHSYAYDFNSRVHPLGVARQVPAQDARTFAWIDGLVTSVIQLLGNYLSLATKHFSKGKAIPNERTASWSKREFKRVEDFYQELTDGLQDLTDLAAQLHQHSHPKGPLLPEVVDDLRHSSLLGVVDRVVKETESVLTNMAERLFHLESEFIAERIKKRVEKLRETLLSELGDWFAKFLGLYGPARSMADYTKPFSLMLLPSSASNSDTDRMFARMRLAGPNPVVIQRIRTHDAFETRFPVSDAQYRAAMPDDAEDSLGRARSEGRLYLADYSRFKGLATGRTSGGQKYIEAPQALFAVPRSGPASERWLRPVAIQLSQESGAPIFTPADEVSWKLARLHVQVADGNYHELISHLGLTHLVLEQFTLATHRQLSVQHPLYLLLAPHFQGTLSINDGAVKNLIAPGGPVDLLLSLNIDKATQVCVDSVKAHRINQSFLPRALALRGVEDAEMLPDYPYRDDGLLLWSDIHTWVKDYLSVYYLNDAAVQADYELQGWLRELSSTSGGQLLDIGEEGGGIQTRTYLTDLLTYVIFTASAQHAAVNFPQRTLMSFTPALPLAAYAPGPTIVDPLLPESAQLAHLPPLQMALLQQVVGFGLGDIYFTRLGAYDAYLRAPWFQDARVSPLLSLFQERLRITEQTIGRRNLSRIPYDTLLPSAIPQSINI